MKRILKFVDLLFTRLDCFLADPRSDSILYLPRIVLRAWSSFFNVFEMKLHVLLLLELSRQLHSMREMLQITQRIGYLLFRLNWFSSLGSQVVPYGERVWEP